MKEMTQKNKFKSGAGTPGSRQIVAPSHEKWFREHVTRSKRQTLYWDKTGYWFLRVSGF
jgi:hypothetical protein